MFLHNLRIVVKERFGTQAACAEATGINVIRLNRLLCGRAEATQAERERLITALAIDPNVALPDGFTLADWLFYTPSLLSPRYQPSARS